MKRIPLTQGKFAIVDDEDFEKVSVFKWHFSNGYAMRGQHIRYDGKKKIVKGIFMHRLIMDTPDGMDTDHINHDKLDNRKENLRICTRGQNTCNNNRKPGLSGFRGVNRSGGKWQARIKTTNSYINLGTFKTPKEAAKARNEAAKIYHGEFAVLNEFEKMI